MKRKKTICALSKYLRELSIVIIGVLITLFITNTISSINKRSEIDKTLELIKIEMSENLISLTSVQAKWETEQRGYVLILKNIDHIANLPADTLEQLRKIIGDKHAVLPNKDSYEVLKSSSLMQYIQEKTFLRELSGCYEKLEEINQKLQNYSNLKGNGITHLMNNVDHPTLNRWISGSVYDYFQVPLADNAFRAFVYSGSTILCSQDFEDCKAKVANIIGRIEHKKY